MGKRKAKRRKNKLARPPKQKSRPVWEDVSSPHTYDADDALAPNWMDTGMEAVPQIDDLDALQSPVTEPERPFGSVDPSMLTSTRYQKFKANVQAIRESVPEEFETFATYHVPDMKLRRWLTRFCVKNEADKLPGWQQVMLEKIGFNWVRGHAPGGSVQSNASQLTWDAHWSQRCAELSAKLSQAEQPILALLTCDDEDYDWLRRQILSLNAQQLKAEREAELRALPIDIEIPMADKGFTRWRTSFKAFMEANAPADAKWAILQRSQLRAGKLADWRISVLDAISFDWKGSEFGKPAPRKRSAKPKTPKVRIDPVQRMEDRWRKKLDIYFELEAKFGKPLSLLREEAAPLRAWHSRMCEHYRKGKLRPELIAEFEARGFSFRRGETRKEKREAAWNKQFAKIEAFKERFGHPCVPSTYNEDPKLGMWLGWQRERLTKGTLAADKREKLLAIGIEPSKPRSKRRIPKTHLSAWMKVFKKLEALVKEQHGGRLPEDYKLKQSMRNWLQRQRAHKKAGKLDAWQLEQLDAIGFNPTPPARRIILTDWDERLERLQRFIAENGHAHVSRSCPDGKLYTFVQRARQLWRQGELDQALIDRLLKAGFEFDPGAKPTPAWMGQYESLKAYTADHGDSAVPRSYPPDQGLSEFVAQQKQRGRKGLLLAEHIRLLDSLDFPWTDGKHPVAKDAKA